MLTRWQTVIVTTQTAIMRKLKASAQPTSGHLQVKAEENVLNKKWPRNRKSEDNIYSFWIRWKKLVPDPWNTFQKIIYLLASQILRGHKRRASQCQVAAEPERRPSSCYSFTWTPNSADPQCFSTEVSLQVHCDTGKGINAWGESGTVGRWTYAWDRPMWRALTQKPLLLLILTSVSQSRHAHTHTSNTSSE